MTWSCSCKFPILASKHPCLPATNQNVPGHYHNRTHTRTQSVPRRGLTLLELLVVLVILAIVATVAVNSLQPRVESTRFEQTRTQLNHLQNAAIGKRQLQQPDGSPLISGFVADVGRLPRPESGPLPVSGDPGGRELSELWNTQSELAVNYPFRFRSGPSSPVDYSSIQIPCGWRGPYLHLPLGKRAVRDPWNRPFELGYSPAGTIDCITWNPVGNYDQPLQCVLKSGKVIVSGTIDFGPAPSGDVQVALLGPDPDRSLSELVVREDEDTNAATFSFSDVAVGLKALHITHDGQQLTKYVQVPHEGLTLAINLKRQTPETPADTTSDESTSESPSGTTP